ncbi:MAG TPA: hypothetical protein VFS14_01660 [Candidatus Saccharimonadales bacterium]|nr:hypothetical protein [Candidatus Saccharimonadales bacterium]
MPKKLESVVASSAPLLETALHLEDDHRLDPELQLRGTVCGLATAALQLYMSERHNIKLDRRIATPEKAPRGLNSRRLNHVVLFGDDEMVDPSFGQVYAYVGLSQRAAQERPALRQLFPDKKMAVVVKDSTDQFADDVAAHMQAIEPEVARLRSDLPAYPPENALVGSPLAKKQEVMRDIWTPGGFEPYPLSAQSSSFQNRALRLAERMHELER